MSARRWKPVSYRRGFGSKTSKTGLGWMTKYLLVPSGLFIAGVSLFLVVLRLTHLGVIIVPLEQTDPSGIGMAYECQWKVWNLWFTPVNVDIAGTTCSCISCDTSEGTVPFGRARKVSLTVSAVGKNRDFEEKAVMQITRGGNKLQTVLNVRCKGFAALYVWPDAINVPASAQKSYSEVVKVMVQAKVPFEDITIRATDESTVRTQWLRRPELASDGSYAQADLEVTVVPKREQEEYIAVCIKDTVVKTLRVFSH